MLCLVHSDKYSVNLVSLNFCILSLYLVNGPQVLYVNPGCLKSIPGINLFSTNESLFTISLILYS